MSRRRIEEIRDIGWQTGDLALVCDARLYVHKEWRKSLEQRASNAKTGKVRKGTPTVSVGALK